MGENVHNFVKMEILGFGENLDWTVSVKMSQFTNFKHSGLKLSESINSQSLYFFKSKHVAHFYRDFLK